MRWRPAPGAGSTPSASSPCRTRLCGCYAALIAMSINPSSRRRFGATLAAALALALTGGLVPAQPAAPGAGTADYSGPLFDTHLHYNEEADAGSAAPMCWRA